LLTALAQRPDHSLNELPIENPVAVLTLIWPLVRKSASNRSHISSRRRCGELMMSASNSLEVDDRTSADFDRPAELHVRTSEVHIVEVGLIDVALGDYAPAVTEL
jgi:hypothetical protein